MKKISDLKKTMVLSLLALFCFALLLFFLYHYDNKYFQKSPQPVSGQYYLTEEDFKEQSVFFSSRRLGFLSQRTADAVGF